VTRRRRSEIVVRGNAGIMHAMAQEIRETHVVRVLQEPGQSLVMVKVRETARNSLFYVGELIVMEAKVAIGEVLGLGIVQDEDIKRAEQRALDAAVIDAAYSAKLPQTENWTAMLEAEEEKIRQAELQEKRMSMESCVNFDIM